MSKKRRKQTTSVKLNFEKLEQKRCLASVGWDGFGQGGAELTYYLGDAPSQVDQATFESVIEKALDVWSDVADIEFTETTTPGRADSLDITFASLDGAGGVLARAYFPDDVNRSTIAGDVQFDSSERWEVGNDQGSRAFDLLYVAVHEIGHALGLEHSRSAGSVLGDTVSPNQSFVQLDQDDKNAILSLYAPASRPTNPTADPVAPGNTEPPAPTNVDPIVPPTSMQNPVDDSNGIDNSDPDGDTNESEQEEKQNRRWRRFHRFGQFTLRRFGFFFNNNFVDVAPDSNDDQSTDRTEHSPKIRIYLSPGIFPMLRFFRGFR